MLASLGTLLTNLLMKIHWFHPCERFNDCVKWLYPQVLMPSQMRESCG
jgi:hypothetical protein